MFDIDNHVRFFIPDFFCPEIKSIIEVDGDIHDKHEQKEYDMMRSETLKEMGYRILRFKNKQILENVDNVFTCIENHVETIKK